MSADHPVPDVVCGRRKPEAPQQGERCVFLPHRGSPGHSWEPWSTGTGTESQREADMRHAAVFSTSSELGAYAIEDVKEMYRKAI